MAEGIDPRNEEMLKKLAETLEKFGTQSKTLGDRLNELDKKYLQHQMVTGRYVNDIKENAELTKQLNLRKNQFEKKYIEDYKKFSEEQKKLVKNREITEQEANDNIRSFNKNLIESIEDPELKNTFQQFTKNLDAVAERSRRFEVAFGENGAQLKKTLSDVSASIVGAAGNIIKSYRDTGSQTGFATTILSEGASAAGSTLQSMGGLASSAGEAVSGMGRSGRIAGMALQGLGAVASIAGGAIKEVAQKAFPFLSQELEKNLQAFQSLSSSGALFSNGLTGMIETAGTAGMTLDMFNNVVKNNTGSLSALGEGVTAGANRAARALQAGGDGMRKQLLNLGYSIEEQGSLVAETMETMRQSGGRLTASDAEVAEQTKKYAENLRVISSITGEDAKKKMDQIKKENMNLAFQQKLASMDETQRAAIVRAQANMSDLQRQAFQQMMVFGQVVTPELAATVAQSENLRGSVEDAVRLAQSNQLDEVSMRQIQSQRGDAIKQELISLQGLAQAGLAGVGGLIGNINQSLATELDFRNRFNETSVRNAEEGARGQRETADALTASMNDVVKANVEAAKEIQTAILQSGVMTGFATVTKQATEALTSLIQKFTQENAPGQANVEAERVRNEATGRAIGEAAGAAIGGMLGSIVPGAGTVAGGIVGGMVGGAVGGAVGRTTTITEEQRSQLTDLTGQGGIPGFARGGVVDAPKTGMLAKLHGSEMVLPLPDNFRASAFSDLLGSLSDLQKSMSQKVTSDVTPTRVTDYLATLTEAQRQLATEQMLYNQNITPDTALLTASLTEEINKAFANKLEMESAVRTNVDESVPVLTKLSDQMEELLTATRLVVANTERTARGVA